MIKLTMHFYMIWYFSLTWLLQGLIEISESQHELAVIPKVEETYESLDTGNYRKVEIL